MPIPALPSRCRPFACPLAHLAYAAVDVRSLGPDTKR